MNQRDMKLFVAQDTAPGGALAKVLIVHFPLQRVARTRFCVSGCGDTVFVFLQLLSKDMACG